MGPIAALTTTLRKTFQFSGRATRAEFWWSWVMLWFVAVGLDMNRYVPMFGTHSVAIMTILLCAVMLPMISIGTRRLADAGVWRWFFVLTVALSFAQQLFYIIPMPSASDLWMMGFQAERDDVTLPLSGYDTFKLLSSLRRDILPWAIRISAIACVLLALLPSRITYKNSGPNPFEVTP